MMGLFMVLFFFLLTLQISSCKIPNFRHRGYGDAGVSRHGRRRRRGEGADVREGVVTPSDVGKLNRLVTPKQHAEKYFPLDAAAGEKGLLLNFEECRSSGKSWRFRYSYWSSSQSYVITKGWSRFVKDKKLDAGDVVSFFRSFADDSVNGARLYIDWSRRRRPDQRSATLQFHHRISINPWSDAFESLTTPCLTDKGGLSMVGTAAATTRAPEVILPM